jgi:YD repeat-containing protein
VIVYMYDRAGRLTASVTDNRTAAIYAYDAANNLLRIERSTDTSPRIVQLSTTEGAPGDTLEILVVNVEMNDVRGVTFGGEPATILDLSPMRMEVEVPDIDGSVTITLHLANVTIDAQHTFRAMTRPSAPVVSRFLPRLGSPGSTVEVLGSALTSDNIPVNAFIGSSSAIVERIASDRLHLVVPAGGSGALMIETEAGVVSTQPDLFIVVPRPWTTEQVAFGEQVALGTAIRSPAIEHGHIALLVFAAIGTDRVSVVLGEAATTIGRVSLLDDRGGEVANELVFRSGGLVGPMAVRRGSTQTIIIEPTDDNSGSADVTVHAVPPEVSGLLTVDDSGEAIATEAPGQGALLSFSGHHGERCTVGLADVSFSRPAMVLRASAIDPEGTELDSRIVASAGGVLVLDGLPLSGDYTVRILPEGVGTFPGTFGVRVVLSDTVELSLAETPVEVSIERDWQRAVLLLDGVEAGRAQLVFTNVMFEGELRSFEVTVLNEGGDVLAREFIGRFGATVNVEGLERDGRYELRIDPAAPGRLVVTVALVA